MSKGLESVRVSNLCHFAPLSDKVRAHLSHSNATTRFTLKKDRVPHKSCLNRCLLISNLAQCRNQLQFYVADFHPGLGLPAHVLLV